MKIKIVYFAYLIPDKWLPIVEEQLDSLKSLELYNESSNIYMTVISDDNQLTILKKLLADKYSKVEINNVFQDNVYEYPGLKTIYQIAEDDDDTLTSDLTSALTSALASLTSDLKSLASGLVS